MPVRISKTPSFVPRTTSYTSTKLTLGSALACRHATTNVASTTDLDVFRGDRQRVVVLGSGWSGHSLIRNLDPKHYQTVLISPRTHFIFTPLLASSAVGTLEFRTVMEPVRWNSASWLSRIFKGKAEEEIRTRPIFFQGWADSVDFKRKVVKVENAVDDHGNSEGAELRGAGDTYEVPYDKLVIAVGCYSQTFGIEGVAEHAFFLKDVGQARRIRKRILDCFELAALPTCSERRRKRLLHFAIVGGGPTGMEFAAELQDLLNDDMKHLYPQLVPYMQVTVFDVASKVLAAFDEDLSKYAEKHFARQGIEIRTGIRVKSVNDKGLILTKDGQEEIIPAGMTVWNTGLANTPFVDEVLGGQFELQNQAGEFVVKKDRKTKRVVTDDRLRLKMTTSEKDITLPDVFALGDCAAIENQMLPATAQVASQEAAHLAKMLNGAAKAKNGELVDQKAFAFRNWGMMAYLGGWRAIMGGENRKGIKGRAAWLAWRFAYLSKSISWRNRILVAVYWFISSVFGRDVSRF